MKTVEHFIDPHGGRNPTKILQQQQIFGDEKQKFDGCCKMNRKKTKILMNLSKVTTTTTTKISVSQCHVQQKIVPVNHRHHNPIKNITVSVSRLYQRHIYFIFWC
jgi:CRISPR/Cas system CSM-associated protein Csm5 (group 7 of RAMP superfamily)